MPPKRKSLKLVAPEEGATKPKRTVKKKLIMVAPEAVTTEPFLYPSLDDPKFNVKIAEKQEFYEAQYDGTIHPVEERAAELCDAQFELAPHQLFVKRFMSAYTPYNSLLL